MSRTHENPMEDLLKMLFGDETSTNEKQEKSVPPTETKGFKSLVSEEEYKAIISIKEAMDNYIDVHNRNAISLTESVGDANTYARLQYMMVRDIFDDLQKAVVTLYNIHSLDKDFIDSLVKESGAPSLKAFEHVMMMDALRKIMLGE